MADTRILITLLTAFLGWIFLVYLSNRTLKRGEISRQKDVLIERIDNHVEWLIEELNHAEAKNNFFSIEEKHTAKLVQIELKLNNLNDLVGSSILESHYLSELKGYDLESHIEECCKQHSQDDGNLLRLAYDFIEHIETRYSQHYFKKNMLARFASTKKDILAGTLFGALALYLLLQTLRIIF